MMTSDPHHIIPIGFSVPGQYEVVGFVNPAGNEVLKMMVCIKYPDYIDNVHGYSTTRYYLTILRDYLTRISLGDTIKIIDDNRPLGINYGC